MVVGHGYVLSNLADMISTPDVHSLKICSHYWLFFLRRDADEGRYIDCKRAYTNIDHKIGDETVCAKSYLARNLGNVIAS